MVLISAPHAPPQHKFTGTSFKCWFIYFCLEVGSECSVHACVLQHWQVHHHLPSISSCKCAQWDSKVVLIFQFPWCSHAFWAKHSVELIAVICKERAGRCTRTSPMGKSHRKHSICSGILLSQELPNHSPSNFYKEDWRQEQHKTRKFFQIVKIHILQIIWRDTNKNLCIFLRGNKIHQVVVALRRQTQADF